MCQHCFWFGKHWAQIPSSMELRVKKPYLLELSSKQWTRCLHFGVNTSGNWTIFFSLSSGYSHLWGGNKNSFENEIFGGKRFKNSGDGCMTLWKWFTLLKSTFEMVKTESFTLYVFFHNLLERLIMPYNKTHRIIHFKWVYSMISEFISQSA